MTTTHPDSASGQTSGLSPAALADEIRNSYERGPYPVEPTPELKVWNLPPWAWMWSRVRPGMTPPVNPRVLIAGCGSGAEALRVANSMPASFVEAVDFSPKSIEIAKQHQQNAGLNNVRFQVADLTSPDFVAMFRDQPFDFISCHGVIMYIPDSAQAVKNFAELLKPDGILYIGTNGPAHVSAKLRPFLVQQGYDLNHFEDSPKIRNTLKIYDAVANGGFANQSTVYLANDLFGWVINNWSLTEWMPLFKDAGLHYIEANHQPANLVRTTAQDLSELYDKTPGEIALFFDGLLPTVGFYRMILTKNPPAFPPFSNQEEFKKWRPISDLVPRTQLVPQAPPYNTSISITINISGLHHAQQFNMSRYLLEIVRRADGKQSLGKMMASLAMPDVEMDDVIPPLFYFYLTNILHFLPPLTGEEAPEPIAPAAPGAAGIAPTSDESDILLVD